MSQLRLSWSEILEQFFRESAGLGGETPWEMEEGDDEGVYVV